MTRAEMAHAIKYAVAVWNSAGFDPVWSQKLEAAAAELAKDCAGCKWFIHSSGKVKWSACAVLGGMHNTPTDGSGFCHRWEAKP